MQKQRTIRVNDSGFKFSRFSSLSKDFVMFDCNSCIVFVEFGRWVIIGMALAAITFTVLAAIGAFISYKVYIHIAFVYNLMLIEPCFLYYFLWTSLRAR